MKTRSKRTILNRVDIRKITRVSIKSLCEKDGKKMYLSLAKVEELKKKEQGFTKQQKEAIKKAAKILRKGFHIYKKYQDECQGKSMSSVPRKFDGESYEWHHLCLKSLNGSDTLGVNVIPLSPLDHATIHVLVMFFVTDWQVALSASFMLNKRNIYLEDILGWKEVDIEIYSFLTSIDRQARSEMNKGRSKGKRIKKNEKKKSKYYGSNNDIPLFKDCFRYGYSDKDAVVYFQQFVHNSEKKSKPYIRWLKIRSGHLFQFRGRSFMKGVDGEDLRVKRHLNVTNRAEKMRTVKADIDLGKNFTKRDLKTLAFIDEDGEYAIMSRWGHRLTKIRKLQKPHLRKLCGACSRMQHKRNSDMVAEIIDFLSK